MKIMFRSIAITVLSSCLMPVAWSADTEAGLVKAFSQCDASFFHYLRQHKNELQAYAPIELVGNVAHFKQKNGDNTVQFTKPLVVDSMTFIGFTDEPPDTLPFNDGVDFYFWKFIIKNTHPDAVVLHFPQFTWHKHIDGYSAGEQIINDVNTSKMWAVNTSATSNTIPAKNTAEKLLYLAQGENGTVEMTCTLQGKIPQNLLHSIRPDIK